MAAYKEGASLAYIHQDHLTGTSVTTDASGSVLGTIKYKPFGETRSISGPLPAQKFTGQRFDNDVGLYYYGARYYDPDLGRFTAADSLILQFNNPQDLNRYSYVNNNPLKYIDPSGHVVAVPPPVISYPPVPPPPHLPPPAPEPPTPPETGGGGGGSGSSGGSSAGAIGGPGTPPKEKVPPITIRIKDTFTVHSPTLALMPSLNPEEEWGSGRAEITIVAAYTDNQLTVNISILSTDISMPDGWRVSYSVKIQVESKEYIITLKSPPSILPERASYFEGTRTIANISPQSREVMEIRAGAINYANLPDSLAGKVPMPWAWRADLRTGKVSRIAYWWGP